VKAASLLRQCGESARRSGMTLLDLVFPRFCCLCRSPLEAPSGRVLCPCCAAGLERFAVPPCPGCGGAPAAGPLDFCLSCRGAFHRDGLFALAPYVGSVRSLIHSFKYRAVLGAGRTLGLPLAAGVARTLGGHFDVLVPVPLSRRRLRARGFNQAALLARAIGRQTARPVLYGVLRRKIDTRPLAGLDPRQRRRELRGGMVVRSPAPARGRRVLLVDDIFTSGATAEECCRVLKGAGAAAVVVAVAGRVLPGVARTARSARAAGAEKDFH
jgi:ComF family protein